jgi:hypothetical protein
MPGTPVVPLALRVEAAEVVGCRRIFIELIRNLSIMRIQIKRREISGLGKPT